MALQLETVALRQFSTMGVGGLAEMVRITDEDTLLRALDFAETHNRTPFVLGGGSNILFPDEGVSDLIFYMQDQRVHYEAGQVTCGAGAVFDDVINTAVKRGWAGIECLSGIPGTAGAAPIQNIGAYGQEIAETLVRVRAWDRLTQAWVDLDRDACAFSYRDSRFKREANRYIITQIQLQLTPGGSAPLRYPDLQKADLDPSDLRAVRQTVLQIRASKGMVYDPFDVNSHSCGSFFTNPILTAEEYALILPRLPADHPVYPAGTSIKLSAAWLIERAGIFKGTRLGNAATSQKHSLALINPGQASAHDLKDLARWVQEKVRTQFGVNLQPEPLVWGGL